MYICPFNGFTAYELTRQKEFLTHKSWQEAENTWYSVAKPPYHVGYTHVAWTNYFHATDWIGSHWRKVAIWENPFWWYSNDHSDIQFPGCTVAVFVCSVSYIRQHYKLWHHDISNTGRNVFTGLNHMRGLGCDHDWSLARPFFWA